jgi:hypothetical protein
MEERRMTVSKPEEHDGASEERSSDPAADADPVPDADVAADTGAAADTSHYTLILGNGPGRHPVAPEIENAAPEPHGIWVAGGVGRRAQDEAGAGSNAASDEQPSRCGRGVADDRRK